MWEFLKENFSTIISVVGTAAGVWWVHRTGHKISVENAKVTLRKTDTEAADSVRDDLMKQVEESNKRIDKKDEIIDNLNRRIQELEKGNLELTWQNYIKTNQIEQLQRQLAELEKTLGRVDEKLKQAGYGN